MFVLYFVQLFSGQGLFVSRNQASPRFATCCTSILDHDLYSDFHRQVLEDREVLDHSKEFVVQVGLW